MNEDVTTTTTAAPSGSAGYEVEGEPGVYWCARHRKVKTRLRCGRCEKPICAKCTTYGPTGARCPECASYRGTHVYQVTPLQYAVAGVAAILLGSVAGLIASMLSIFALFYAPVAGTFIGKAISYITKHKRGPALAVIASAGLVIGAMIPSFHVLLLLWLGFQHPSIHIHALTYLLTSNILNPFTWVYLALAIPSVWYWLK